MDGIEVDKLSPSPFLWLGLYENFLEKIILLKCQSGGAVGLLKKEEEEDGCKKTMKEN